MPLPTRKIGSTDVSAIGYGAMGIAAFYGSVQPDEERLAVLDALYAKGCTNWDTSNIYGDSEVLIGKWYVVVRYWVRDKDSTDSLTCIGSKRPGSVTRSSWLRNLASRISRRGPPMENLHT